MDNISEKDFEQACEAYAKHFGINYGYSIGFGWPSGKDTFAENIAFIKACIETNTPAPEPEYEPDMDY